jgi:divalent metal cation (Fe/Co/Zn/Cd) transporter
VALFIISATIRMAKRAIDVLLDRAPTEIEKTIRVVADSFAEVLNIADLRLRSDGRTTFGALNLDVDRSLTFSRASELKRDIRRELRKHLPDADITLTFTPASKESEMVADSIRFAVSTFNLPLHHLIINQTENGYFVSMHVEMPGALSLDEAHEQSEMIKQRLHETIDNLYKVVIHTQPYEIEPESRGMVREHADRIEKQVEDICDSFPNVEDCHSIVLTPFKGGMALSCDVRLDGELSLDDSHLIAKELEEKLRIDIPELVSVTLHLEPFEK